MPSLELTLPPNELRVNRRLGRHWGSTQAAKKNYAMRVAFDLSGQRGVTMEGPWPVRLDVTLVLGPRQRCDNPDAGTWCKSLFDVLTRLGFWPDDSATYLDPITFHVEKKDRKNPRVVLRWT